MTYVGTLRGGVIELDEPLPFAEGQRLRVDVEPAEPPRGSPAAVLAAMRRPPHLSAEDVDELDRAIAEGKRLSEPRGVFDREGDG